MATAKKITSIKQLKAEIEKAKKKLMSKSPCENFGMKEFRKLEDRITHELFTEYYADCANALNEFCDWCG